MYRLQRGVKDALKEPEEREKVNRTFYIFRDQVEALEESGAPSRKLREILDLHLRPGSRGNFFEEVEAVLEQIHFYAESQEVRNAIQIVEEALPPSEGDLP